MTDLSDTTNLLSASDRAKLGRLSSASVSELSCLFDACMAAKWVWLGASNMPRSGDGVVVDIADDEEARCSEIRDAVAYELLRRRNLAADDEAERARVLMQWSAYATEREMVSVRAVVLAGLDKVHSGKAA